MKKILSIGIITMLIIVACNKDQKVVKQLDGTWKVSNVTVDGAPVDQEEYKNLTYEFEKCKLKDGDCNGTLKISDPSKGTFSFPFTYKISDDGTKLHMTVTMMGSSSTEHGDIIESSKSKFVFSTKDDDGKVMVTTLTKV
jgi:hypothetical protein